MGKVTLIELNWLKVFKVIFFSILKAWAAKSGAAIIQFRAACRRYLRLLTAPSNAVGYFFFFYNFWQTPFNDLDHYLKLFVYLPVLTWYFIFCKRGYSKCHFFCIK